MNVHASLASIQPPADHTRPCSRNPRAPDHLSVVREGSHWVLRCEATLFRDLPEVFRFFADARNLEKLTPSVLRFRVLTPEPIVMGDGLRIDYALRVRGVPVRWQSEILCWDPPYGFADHATRSPYALWQHEHTFESIITEHGPATIVRDMVRYRPLGGKLAALVNTVFVKRELRKIFRFRTARIAEVLEHEGAERDA
jgi:ligand-binding SRPBCC domain-containing protein